LASSESRRVTLPADVALHARPAAVFVREAAKFGAAVAVHANGKQANARSILEVLALGASGGTELEIEASGDDAVAAVEQLVALVEKLSR
jgi:phosphocarrier protein HPr